MIELIAKFLGFALLIGGGFAITGLVVSHCCAFLWNKLISAYDLKELRRVVRLHGKRKTND